MLEAFSTALGILSFFLLRFMHFVTAYAGYIIIASLISIVLSICFWKKTRASHWVAPFAFALLILSIYETNKSIQYKFQERENELIADATECAVYGYDTYSPSDKDWLTRAVLEDQLVYLLIPAKQKYQTILLDAYDERLVDRDAEGNLYYRMMAPQAELENLIYESRYYLLALYRPFIKAGYAWDGYRVLPESVSMTMRGYVSQLSSKFDEAKGYYQQADSLSNSTATAYLSMWYSTGFGVPPNEPKADSLMVRAANNGCRAARLQLGTSLLSDKTTTALQRAKAEDYLKRAAFLHSVATNRIALESEQAAIRLNSYFRMTGRYYDAYYLSKKCSSLFSNPNIRYGVHLDNCLSLGKRKEAMALIKEGEGLRYPNSYLAHAEVYMRGEWVNQNLAEAERLLRYAADSLGAYSAYSRLASIYMTKGDKRSAYLWQRMYHSHFNTSFEDE